MPLCPVPSSSLRLPWLQPRAGSPPPPPLGREFREPGKEGGSSRARLALPSSWLCPPSFPARSTLNDPIAGVQQIKKRGLWEGEPAAGGSRRSCAQPFLAARDPVSFLLCWLSSKGDCVAGMPLLWLCSPPPAAWPAPYPPCQAPAAQPCTGRACFPCSLLLGAGLCSLQTTAHPACLPAVGSTRQLQGRARLWLAKMGCGQ